MYTDNLLTSSLASYPAPHSWFVRVNQPCPHQNSEREDMRLIEQMICNEVLEPLRSGRQFVKGLRTIRENGSHWLSLFANDLLLVMPMTRIASLNEEARVSKAVQSPEGGAVMEEVVIDEWPVPAHGGGEDVYFRNVDALEPGAILEIKRDVKSPQRWRLLSRHAVTGDLALEVVGSQRQLTRTRGGLAAELRRGTCHILPSVADPKPMWTRMLDWLHSS